MSLHSAFTARELHDWLDQPEDKSFIAASAAVSSKAIQNLQDLKVPLSEPCLWIATSGTTQKAAGFPQRWIGHRIPTLYASARAVCSWLDIRANDRWGRVLPLHHMGGLSIEIRSRVAGFSCLSPTFSWNPRLFTEWVEAEKISVVSLVPTQIYDLVQHQISCPSSLRFAIVGGDRLDLQLFERAAQLGWRLLPSYGMTETASMIACFKQGSTFDLTKIPVLPEVQVSTEQGRLKIQCNFLFDAEARWNEPEGCYQFSPRPPGEWLSEDDALVFQDQKSQLIRPLGRSQDFVKISGEGIRVLELDDRLRKLLKSHGYSGEAIFGLAQDERRGKALILVLTSPFPQALELWNNTCQPIERADRVHHMDSLPTTELGKIKRPTFS